MLAIMPRSSSLFAGLPLALAFVASLGACAAPAPDAEAPGVRAQNDDPPWEDDYGVCTSNGDCGRGAFCCADTQTCEARTAVAMCVPPVSLDEEVDVNGLVYKMWDSLDIPASAFGEGECPEVQSVIVRGYRDRVAATTVVEGLTQCECEGAELALQLRGWIDHYTCRDYACHVHCCDVDPGSEEYGELCTTCWEAFYLPGDLGDVTVAVHGRWEAGARGTPSKCVLRAEIDTEDPNHHFPAYHQGVVAPIEAIAGAKLRDGKALEVSVSARRGEF